MPDRVNNVILSAVADAKTYTVVLTWANGEMTTSRFGDKIGKGVFAALADPVTFMKVRIGERGRSLEWPGEIDVCADALWYEAHPEDAPQAQRSGHHPAHQSASP